MLPGNFHKNCHLTFAWVTQKCSGRIMKLVSRFSTVFAAHLSIFLLPSSSLGEKVWTNKHPAACDTKGHLHVIQKRQWSPARNCFLKEWLRGGEWFAIYNWPATVDGGWQGLFKKKKKTHNLCLRSGNALLMTESQSGVAAQQCLVALRPALANMFTISFQIDR